MNCELGLSRLESSLTQVNNIEALRLFERLRDELAWSTSSDDRIAVIRRLDRLACRYVGVSFEMLCAQNNRKFSSHLLSLRHLLYLLLVIMLLPGFAAVFAAPNQQFAQIEQIEQQTREIDNLVASGLVAPFYLNEAKGACSRTAQQRLVMARIMTSLSNDNDEGCTWTYTDVTSSEVIVRDYWSTEEGLITREYLSKDSVIAEDDFNQGSGTCFKRRTYFSGGSPIARRCFSEAGVQSVPEISDTLRSPIPPPFYWFFFYR